MGEISGKRPNGNSPNSFWMFFPGRWKIFPQRIRFFFRANLLPYSKRIQLNKNLLDVLCNRD